MRCKIIGSTTPISVVRATFQGLVSQVCKKASTVAKVDGVVKDLDVDFTVREKQDVLNISSMVKIVHHFIVLVLHSIWTLYIRSNILLIIVHIIIMTI